MNLAGWRALAALALAFPLTAFARQPLDVGIYDRTAGR